MAGLRRYINAYRIIWTAVVVVFVAFIWWFLFIRPASRLYSHVDPGDVKQESLQQQDVGTSFSQKVGKMELNVEGAELSLSSNEGDLIMYVWAQEAIKQESVFTIDEGALQFVISDRSVLFLKVADCVFESNQNVVHVEGSIIGKVEGTDHFFKAEQLSWDRDSMRVTAQVVEFVGPNIQVVGEEMSISLESGKIEFAGPVEAGV